jgi:NodT family efflux transporter outer membrane factor (OMF) lipoprotein
MPPIWSIRHTRSLALSTCATALLMACASGNNIHPALALPDMATFKVGQEITSTTSTGATSTLSWWRHLDDAQLDTLLAMLEHDAPSSQIAQARLRQAQADNNQMQSNLQPAVDGTLTASGDRFPGNYTYSSQYADHFGSQGSATLSLRYHLDFWDKWRQTADAATYREQAAGYEVQDSLLTLQSAVVNAYLQLNAAYQIHDLATQALTLQQDLLRLQEVRLHAGLTTAIKLVPLRDAITQAESDIARSNASMAHYRHEIAALAGQSPAFGDTLQRPRLGIFADPVPVSHMSASLLGYRADVAARRAAVEAAAKDVDVARAAFYPDIDLTGLSGLQSLSLGHLLQASSLMGRIGPAMTLPLFDGGRLRANLKGQVAQYDIAVANYNSTIVSALQQVADGLVQLKAARVHEQLAQAHVEHWIQMLALQVLRQRNGLADESVRLRAEITLLTNRQRLADARADVAMAQVTLVRALGGAWSPSSEQPLISSTQ